MSLVGLLDSYTNLLRSEQSEEELLNDMETKKEEGGGMEYSSGSKAEETMEGVEEGEKEREWEVEGKGSLNVVSAKEQSKCSAELLSFSDMDYLYPLHQGASCSICESDKWLCNVHLHKEGVHVVQ